MKQGILKKAFSKHERLAKLKEQMSNIPTIELDRARIITRFYREYENLPILLKRARAMKGIFENIPVYIKEDELIVGAEGPVPGSVQLYPEYNAFLDKEIDKIETRIEHSRFFMKEELKKEYLQDISPYWKGKTTRDLAFSLIPKDSQIAEKANMITYSTGMQQSIGHTQAKYMDIVRRGTQDIVNDIQERRKKLNLTLTEDVEKDSWYEAAIIVLEAMTEWAKNHVKEAIRLAEKECDERRRNELYEIARICEKVPAKPAESFHEALQAYWFAHIALRLETSAISLSMGRFDQDFIQYLRNDINKGILDMDMAEELLECLWFKFNETNVLIPGSVQPYVTRQALTIGGVDSEGFDATNELTYLALKVHDTVRLHQPSLCLRCHTFTPNNLLLEALRVIRNGSGMPALFNDNVHISNLLHLGANLEDARNYGVIGCVEVAPVNSSWDNCSAGKFNMVKCLMLALNNGVDIKTGMQIGVKTGDPRNFKTFNDLMDAFRAQVAYFVKLQIKAENAIEKAHSLLAPIPLTSVLHEDCIEKGMDVTKGGARYNWAAPQATGQTNAGDSLTAIKKAVFDEKIISMDDLIKAINSDFADNEELRHKLLLIKKYGEDDDEADFMVRTVLKTFTDEVAKYRNFRSGKYHAGSFPGLTYVSYGKNLGATPDGRRAGEPFAAGLSPVNMSKTSNLISIVNSAGKLDYSSASNGTVLTVQLNRSIIQDERGLRNIAAVIRSYFEKGGQEIQFNVISADELREAQKNPEKYRFLVVRVTGWSAFFLGLAKDIQDELIERTELLK